MLVGRDTLMGDKVMESESMDVVPDSSNPNEYDLVMSDLEYSNQCKEMEEAGIQAACTLQVPLLYPFKALSRRECSFLLNKFQHRFSIVERAVFLTAFTDYVTCAVENTDVYDTFRQKSDKITLVGLFKRLQCHWCKFFLSLKNGDMSVSQATSLLVLLKQSIARVPDKHKFSLDIILTIGEKAVSKLATPIPHNEKPKEKEKKNKKEKLLDVVPNSKSALSVKGKKIEMKENVTEKAKTAKPKKKVKAALANGNIQSVSTAKESNKVPQKLQESNIEKLDKEVVKKRKASSTLEKYILKSCENKIPSPEIQVKKDSASPEGPGSSSKVQLATPISTLDQSPKQNTDKDTGYLANGKVNAFKLLMEPKKPKIEENKPEIVKVNAFTVLMQAKRPKLIKDNSPNCKTKANLTVGGSKLKKTKLPAVKCK